MKIYFKILFFSVLMSQQALAQFVSVPYTMRTPAGNMGMTQHIYMPTHYGNGNSNPKFDFEVMLKNDSVVRLRSRVMSENKKMYVLLKSKKIKRKIFPGETKEMYGYSLSAQRLKGIVTDSCWLFKIHTGAINCYSSLPLLDISSTIAIQRGEESAIVALTKDNLKEMVGTEDEKTAKWLKSNKLTKVIEYYNEKH